MMIKEFEYLTGFHPDAELYKAIEAEYMDGAYKDKIEFCHAYIDNRKGIAEKIQRMANEATARRDVDLTKKLKEAEAAADFLRQRLDRELEWHEYTDERRMPDKDYKRLAADINVAELSDDDAKKLILQEFGFSPEKVRIRRSLTVKQINKYHTIRLTGTTRKRDPLYSSSDWNYIAFTCCGYEYEMVDGDLNRV